MGIAGWALPSKAAGARRADSSSGVGDVEAHGASVLRKVDAFWVAGFPVLNTFPYHHWPEGWGSVLSVTARRLVGLADTFGALGRLPKKNVVFRTPKNLAEEPRTSRCESAGGARKGVLVDSLCLKSTVRLLEAVSSICVL